MPALIVGLMVAFTALRAVRVLMRLKHCLLYTSMKRQKAIDLTRAAFAFIASYEGEIPGASERECGNWRDHRCV